MFKLQYKHLINMDGIKLKPSDVCKSQSIVTLFAVSAVASHFLKLLKCNTILPHSTLLATMLCLTSYEQCSTRPLKMLHKCCNTDVLRVLLICPHSSLGAAMPWDHAHRSVKPLAAMLQPINKYYIIICRIHINVQNLYNIANYIVTVYKIHINTHITLKTGT